MSTRAARRLPLAIVALGLALAPTGAAAQGLTANLPGLGRTSFTVTSTTIGRFRGDNFDRNVHDDMFGSLTERLDLSMTAAPWRFYVRVDGFVPFGQDTSCTEARADDCYLTWNVRPGSFRPSLGGTYDNVNNALPERVAIRYQREGLTLEAGDYYQVFGRGLTLAFRKVDPIGLDTTLRGGRFEFERDRLTVRGFAGLGNPQNLDPISLRIFADPQDLLTGASVAARAGEFGDLEFSGHAVHASFERDALTRRQDDVDIAGVRFEFPSLFGGDLTVYGEANVLSRSARLSVGDNGVQSPGAATRRSWGRGVYAAAQVTRGAWTFLAEWKDYTNYLLAPTQLGGAQPQDVARIYSQAPSLERDDQRIFTNANTRGGRLRVDYAVPDSAWIFSANSVLYGWSDHFDERGDLVDPWDDVNGYLTSHSYVGVRRRSRPVFQTTGGAPAAGGGAAAQQGASGAAIPSGGGLSGASATRVAPGDFNLVATLGYRREFHAGDAPADATGTREFYAGDIKHESLQADFDVAFPVGANDSLELRIDNRFERNFVFDRITGFDLAQLTTGVRGGVALTWSHGMPLVVSAMLRWDNTNRASGSASLFDQPIGRRPDPSMPRLDPLLPTLYPSLEVRWNFTVSNFVRVFGGMTPGGRVCSGGVCRDVPLFQGAVAELVFRL